MVIERWKFVENFERAKNMVCYKLEVDYKPYIDIYVPLEDDPTIVLNACYEVLDQDQYFEKNNVFLHSSYINPETKVVKIYVSTASDYNDNW